MLLDSKEHSKLKEEPRCVGKIGRNSPWLECGAPGAGSWGAGLERQPSQAPGVL